VGQGYNNSSGDVERETRRHDRACQYIVKHAQSLAAKLIGTRDRNGSRAEDGVQLVNIPRMLTRREVLVEKHYSQKLCGEPIYIDVVISTYTEEHRACKPPAHTLRRDTDLIVEVKAGAAPLVGPALRQLKGYQYWYNNSTLAPPQGEDAVDGWHHTPLKTILVLVTTCSIEAADAEDLKGEGVLHVQLGEDFTRWDKQAYATTGVPDAVL